MTTCVFFATATARANAEQGRDDPPVVIRRGRALEWAHGARILGPSEVRYAREQDGPSGTYCWVETEAEVEALCRS